jgi:putative NADH-flavin reductase
MGKHQSNFAKKITQNMAKKKIDEKIVSDKPRVHKDLDGFDIKINSFGEIQTSFNIDKINQFLNKTVDDKKLRHRKNEAN